MKYLFLAVIFCISFQPVEGYAHKKHKECSSKHRCKKKDPIVGAWIVNARGENDPPERISPELLCFHADGTLTYLFLDVPAPDLPLFSGSKAVGIWEKIGKCTYRFVSAERIGLPDSDEACCPNAPLVIARNSVIVTLSKEDSNKATFTGTLTGFPPFDICLEEEPEFTFDFTGDLCRLQFPAP